VIDVDAAMMRVALEVVGHSLFSTDFTEDADRLVAAVLESLDLVVARASSPFRLPLQVPTPRNRRMRRAVAVLDEAVEPLIRARRSRAEGPGSDLLGAYIAADEDGSALTDAEIRDEVVTLIVAGHETVASSLTWTWHLLGEHPDIADAVAEESLRVAGDRPLNATDLRALELTGRVVTESLRLFPPAWVVSRRALADVDLCGYSIPAGSTLILSPYVTQRDPRNFTDPEAFDPDRWCAGSADRFAYFPFGAGPNLCIGRDFALLEAALILASLARRFRLEPQAGRVVRAEPLVTIRPADGMPMRLSRR
jgi:cytochrome P450